ncbi:lysoplasmalogenase family protein [Streptomyces sp. KL116D]|uniref:lysoplasmalogenase family protein n=1 Tax=Streptomyces sp. KL116D TaxID=3045152 RepID=UPI0035577AA5
MNLPASCAPPSSPCAPPTLSLLAGVDVAHTVLKPLLMPALLAYAVAAADQLCAAPCCSRWGRRRPAPSSTRTPRFLARNGHFAAGYVCYLVLFRRQGTPLPRGSMLGVVPWCSLDRRLALAGPAGRACGAGRRLAMLLTCMAFGAARLGPVASVGGALFPVSGSLIAMGVADWPALPQSDFWVMLTYVAARFLLVRARPRAGRPGRRAVTCAPKPGASPL